MSTTKTVNVTTGKVLNYQVKKAGYKPVIGSVYVDENKTIDVNLVPTSSATDTYLFGDRILDMATFVCYYTPGGNYDNTPIFTVVSKQTVGTGIKNLGVKKSIFATAVSNVEGTYSFVYDGTDWTYNSSAITLSDYGIFYNTATSSVSNGDTIEIEYDIYNKYACFVLDSNYRTNAMFGMYGVDFPSYPTYGSMNAGAGSSETIWYYNQFYGQESATWCNQTLLDNRGYTWGNLPAMNFCRMLGTFVLSSGIQINAMLPNATEVKAIFNNRTALDALDPVIQGGSTAYNLTNWSFSQSRVWTSQEYGSDRVWCLYGDGNMNNGSTETRKDRSNGVVPVFEVPVK